MAIILIVEDEQPVRQLLMVILTPGYQVVQATEVAQAIELARFIQPDLVILDLNLKDHWDGLKVCQTLRRESVPKLAQVPILMLTGYTGGSDITAALAAGATAYVGKPYSPHALLVLIDTLLAKHGT